MMETQKGSLASRMDTNQNKTDPTLREIRACLKHLKKEMKAGNKLLREVFADKAGNESRKDERQDRR
jgi:ribosomal protein L19E